MARPLATDAFSGAAADLDPATGESQLAALQEGCIQHSHAWGVAPAMEEPAISVDEEYPLRNDVIAVSVGSLQDYDDCTESNTPCSFPMNRAENSIRYIGWSDNNAGGQFGYVDIWGDFVVASDPLQVTHYKTGNTTGQVTLSLTVDDVPEAVDPATNLTVSTADDPQTTGTKEITVWDVLRPTLAEKRYYDAASPGECLVLLTATTEVYWSVEGMPGVNITFLGGADPQSPSFLRDGAARYEGLPPGPTDFGLKQVTAMRGNRMVSRHVYIFYSAPATNHPLVEGDPPAASQWPNWYYYWRQTPAGSGGSHTYDPVMPYTGQTRWENAWTAFIGAPCYITSPCNVWGWDGAWGIDFFAWTVLHEEQHVADLQWEWGNADRDLSYDADLDFLRSLQEPEKVPGDPHGSMGYNPSMFATYDDHFNYGTGWSDIEDWCMHRQTPWANGSVDDMDWSQNGKMDVLPSLP